MDTHFRFPGLSVRNPLLESALERRQVIWMKAAAIVHDKKFFESVTVVLQDRPIGVEATPLRIQHDDVLRDGVDKLPKFRFCQLALMNVGSSRVPPNNVSLFVSQRVEANQKPAILTVFSQ